MNGDLVLTAALALAITGSTVPPLQAQEECKSIVDDDTRLACFDTAFGVAPETTSTTDDIGKWELDIETSALTDDTNVYLRIKSDDLIRGKYGDEGKATLFLRCMENTTSAFFVLNDHFLSDIQGYGKIEYRLDKDEMKSISTKASTDNKALGLWSGGQAIPFIKRLLGHDQIIVRATPYNESAIVATFDIKGIDAAIPDLRKTCGW